MAFVGLSKLLMHNVFSLICKHWPGCQLKLQGGQIFVNLRSYLSN